jgi:hypothetical protein
MLVYATGVHATPCGLLHSMWQACSVAAVPVLQAMHHVVTGHVLVLAMYQVPLTPSSYGSRSCSGSAHRGSIPCHLAQG